MDLPDGHVDRVVEDWRGPVSSTTPGAAGRPPTPCGRRRRSSTGSAPDLASLSLTTSEPGDAIRHLAARRAQRVGVRGAGRVGAVLAGLLSGAGVGEIDVRDGGRVEPWDVAPGGLPAESVGDRRDETARRGPPGRPRPTTAPRPDDYRPRTTPRGSATW